MARRKRCSNTGADFHAIHPSEFEIAGTFVIPPTCLSRVQIRTPLGVLGELRACGDAVKLCYRGQKEVHTLKLVNDVPGLVIQKLITEEVLSVPLQQRRG